MVWLSGGAAIWTNSPHLDSVTVSLEPLAVVTSWIGKVGPVTGNVMVLDSAGFELEAAVAHLRT
jgi:hypothetical protein